MEAAHPRGAGEVVDAQRLRVFCTHPRDRPRDARVARADFDSRRAPEELDDDALAEGLGRASVPELASGHLVREDAEERLQAARENVSEKLIERILLVEEVARRKLEADESKVNEAIAGYEKRYANSPMWQQNKERLLPGLRDRLMEENRLERLETAVRAVGDIPEQEIRRFYDERPELFTEPAKLRLHTILLKVAPSAPTSEWDNAKKKAEELIADLRRGANFEELARKHSQDKSASDGGDMGYLHLGMLPEPLQARIDKLAYGDISEPIEVLEGVGVFRLDERVAPRHVEFSQVMERARDLLKREKQQQQWRDFIAGLRKSADVRMGIQPLQSRAN